MTNVIIMSRVSTDEQGERFSLDAQEDYIMRYCNQKKYNVIKSFREDYSAKNFNRPEWKKAVAFIKENKGLISKIIFLRYDRYSRNMNEGLNQMIILGKLGVSIEMAENNVEMDSPESKLVRNIMLTLPEVENEKIAIRSMEGTIKARELGCFTSKAPKGYRNIRIGRNSTLEFSNEAPLIREAFDKMASGIYSGDQVRKWLNSKGVKVERNTFLELIRNKIYIGKISIPAFKGLPNRVVDGLHPAIVSEEVFAAANEVLRGRKRKMVFKLDKSDLYPLNGCLTCLTHDRALTGAGSTGRKQKKYHYYICSHPKAKECKNRFTLEEAESKVIKLLSVIQMSSKVIKMYKDVLGKLFEREDAERNQTIKKLERDIETYNNRREFIMTEYMDKRILYTEYQEMKNDIDLKCFETNRTLQDLKQTLTPFREYLEKYTPLLEDLVGFYEKVDGKTKKRIIGCIFDGKIHFDEEKNANGKYTTPFQILLSASKVLEDSKNRKEVVKDLLPVLAPPSGLEPETL